MKRQPLLNSLRSLACGLSLVAAMDTQAETMAECLSLAIQSASGSVTVSELQTQCEEMLADADGVPLIGTDAAESAIARRTVLERYTRNNPFVVTTHRANYLMPLVYNRNPRHGDSDGLDPALDNFEVQFQLSLKALLLENLTPLDGHLSAAYTSRSFWQAYNRGISSPFRKNQS